MKYLHNYKMFERKQIGNLYHIFSLKNIKYILEHDCLSSYNFNNISTTRNKNMNDYLGGGPGCIFKFELDGDKLSDKYKIKPFQYQTVSTGYISEFEEVIKTNKIEKISKYVKKIIIIKENIEHLKKSGWFNSDGGNLNSIHTNIPTFLRDNIDKIKELYGDIWIQDGVQIKKDDEWLNSILNYPIRIINHGYAQYWRGLKKKDNNSKYTYYIDDVIPLDPRNNNTIDELVIGYEYNDLYLSKNNDFKNITDKIDNYELYLFDFTYNDSPDNIIEDSEDFIHIKKAKLKNIKPIDMN